MKKLLFLLLLAAATMVLPQTELKAQTKLVRAIDTIANTTTRYNTSSSLGAYNAVGVSFTALKTSGTPAGYAYLEGTVDGTNWKIVPGTDSLTIANVSTAQTKFWSHQWRTGTQPALYKIPVTVVPTAGTFTQTGSYIKE